MIYIDFQGGAHGNYLEFVCNKFLANIPTKSDPFNKFGASHVKSYLELPQFNARHYFQQETTITNSKIISIQICADDLLPLSSISLLRAGDYGIDNNLLELDTYHKWNNKNYQWVLDNLINGFFKNQLQSSYNVVKDDSWPAVNNLEDFQNLPNWIQEECLTQHNLKLLELTPESPHCPRHVLREFFKLGFKYPSGSGFMTQQQKMIYDSSNEVYIFPFNVFYDLDLFSKELIKLSQWTGYKFSPITEFYKLHNIFLQKQPYKESKKTCDQLLVKIFNNESFKIPKLDLLQESYLTAAIELHYNIELPNNDLWFTRSQEIFESCQ